LRKKFCNAWRRQLHHGGDVTALEEELARYLGVKHAVTVASGTDALVICMRALGITKVMRLLLHRLPFFATAEAIAILGATPVFADVLESSYNIDPVSVRKKITSKTKAILPVHIFGQPADMDGIMAAAKEYGLKVVEDVCQAIGSEYHGIKQAASAIWGAFHFSLPKTLAHSETAG